MQLYISDAELKNLRDIVTKQTKKIEQQYSEPVEVAELTTTNTRLLEEQVASAADEIALLKERNHNAAQIQAELDNCKVFYYCSL